MTRAVLEKLFPHFVLIIAMILWSSSFIALKFALSVYTPFEVVAGRMFVAALVCIPLAKELWKVLQNKQIRKILLLGVLFEPCLYFLCETFALHYTSAAQAGMVLALTPLCVGVAAWFFLSERLAMQAWVGFAFAVIGVLWLSFSSSASETMPNPLLGNILEFGAVLCAMGYTLSVRYLAQLVKPLVFTAAMALGGAIFYIPLALLPISVEPVLLDVTVPAWLPLTSIAYLGLAVSLFGYGFYNYALSRLSAGETAAYINLIPIITLIMGVCWLGEYLSPVQYMASALIIMGIVLSQTAKVKKVNREK